MMTIVRPVRLDTNLQQGVALPHARGYIAPVAANSATGFDRPTYSRRIGATVPKAGAFFVPAVSFYGGCAQGAFGRAGFLEFRSINLRTAATHLRLIAISGGSSTLGAVLMKHPHALIPSKIRAAAHRAMAIAALHADSSLSVRLTRYNHHMDRARALTALEVAQ